MRVIFEDQEQYQETWYRKETSVFAACSAE